MKLEIGKTYRYLNQKVFYFCKKDFLDEYVLHRIDSSIPKSELGAYMREWIIFKNNDKVLNNMKEVNYRKGHPLTDAFI